MTDQPQTDKKTILVADDDVDFLMQLQLHLTAMGFDVVTAESQAQAEDALGRMRPHSHIGGVAAPCLLQRILPCDKDETSSHSGSPVALCPGARRGNPGRDVNDLIFGHVGS